jgi:hypothetical protein
MAIQESLLVDAVTAAAGAAVLAGVVMAFLYRQEGRKAELARRLILNYMMGRGFTMISFDRIREKIKLDYTDEFLERLPEFYPNEFRRAQLRDGEGKFTKRGLARIERVVVEGRAEVSAG